MTRAPLIAGGPKPSLLAYDRLYVCMYVGAVVRRTALRGVNRHGSRLGPDSKPQDESGDEHVPPCVDTPLPQTGQGRQQTGDEDGSSATKPVVEGNGQPAACYRAAEVGSCVEKPEQPRGARVVSCNPELILVEHLCAIDDRFVYPIDAGPRQHARQVSCVWGRQDQERDNVPMPWTAAQMEQITITIYISLG